MKKIDKRRTYYLTIDTETANGLEDPIVYDIGGCIHDKKGNIYETFSFIIYETFYGMKDLMKSAYYANKIPQYEAQIKNGERKVVRFNTAKQKIKELCDEYEVKAIIAHNARFDYRSTTRTQRYLTKSKYRYFLPYGIPIWDSLKMAKDTICKQPTYQKWCAKNNFLTKNGKPRATAEILYKYISGDIDFKEDYTGLEDVLIEIAITCKCIAQHKPMRRECFA